MVRRVCAVLVLVLVAGPLALGDASRVAAQDATPTADSTAGTDVRYLLPFTPDGLNPGLTVTGTEEGVCGYASSAALDRADAWDCIGDGYQVYDPCFENPYLPPPDAPIEVACLASPFTTDVVVLTLAQPPVREKEALDDPGTNQAGAGDTIEAWDLPWALELANGDQCSLLHGTLVAMAGQTVHYGCVNGGMVIGETNRTSPVWTVSYLAEGAFASESVAVVTAWS